MWKLMLLTLWFTSVLSALHPAHVAMGDGGRLEHLRGQVHDTVFGSNDKLVRHRVVDALGIIRAAEGVSKRAKAALARQVSQLPTIEFLALNAQEGEKGGLHINCDNPKSESVAVDPTEWFVIPIHFNVFLDQDNDCSEPVNSCPRESDIHHIVNQMNDAFAPAQVSFYLHGTSVYTVPRSVHRAVSGGHGEFVLKHRYNKDASKGVLNVYVTDFVSSSNGEDTMVVGVSTFPYSVMKYREENLVIDLLKAGSGPEGSEEIAKDAIGIRTFVDKTGPMMEREVYGWSPKSFMQGILLQSRSVANLDAATLIHEAGHFFGLIHVFQDDCDYVDGDCVDDTPPTAGTAKASFARACRYSKPYSCAALRDDLVSKEGDDAAKAAIMAWRDPVHNYMSYSDSVCVTHFTPGQHRRIREMIKKYRGVDWAAVAAMDPAEEDSHTQRWIAAAKALCGGGTGCAVTEEGVRRLLDLEQESRKAGALRRLETAIRAFSAAHAKVIEQRDLAKRRNIIVRPKRPTRRRPTAKSTIVSPDEVAKKIKEKEDKDDLRVRMEQLENLSVTNEEFRIAMKLPALVRDYEDAWPASTFEAVVRRMHAEDATIVASPSEYFPIVEDWITVYDVIKGIKEHDISVMKDKKRLKKAGFGVGTADVPAEDIRMAKDAMSEPDLAGVEASNNADKIINALMVEWGDPLGPTHDFLMKYTLLAAVDPKSLPYARTVSRIAGTMVNYFNQVFSYDSNDFEVIDNERISRVCAEPQGHTKCAMMMSMATMWLHWNQELGKAVEDAVSISPFLLNDRVYTNLCPSPDGMHATPPNTVTKFEALSHALLDGWFARVARAAERVRDTHNPLTADGKSEIAVLARTTRSILINAEPRRGTGLYKHADVVTSPQFLAKLPARLRDLVDINRVVDDDEREEVTQWPTKVSSNHRIPPMVVYPVEREQGEFELVCSACGEDDLGCLAILSLSTVSPENGCRFRDVSMELSSTTAGARTRRVAETMTLYLDLADKGELSWEDVSGMLTDRTNMDGLSKLQGILSTC